MDCLFEATNADEAKVRMEESLLKLRESCPTARDSLEAFDSLLKIIENVLTFASLEGGEKYRKLRTSNSTLKSKLTRWSGGEEALLALGFVRALNGEELVLPVTFSRQSLEEA